MIGRFSLCRVIHSFYILYFFFLSVSRNNNFVESYIILLYACTRGTRFPCGGDSGPYIYNSSQLMTFCARGGTKEREERKVIEGNKT